MNDPLFLLAHEREDREHFAALKAKLVPTKEALQRECLHFGNRGAFWVVPRAECVSWFRSCSPWRSRDQRLLLLCTRHARQQPYLNALFRFVVAESEVRLLPREELASVLTAPNRDELLIGGSVDQEDGVVVLYRGSLEPVVVPLDWFKPSGDGTRPDPSRFAVTDYGHTVKLGEYEAATSAILYDFNRDYRKTAKARLVEQDKSLGGALRRLRILRGLGQGDFGPEVSAKEVSRIEKGQVKKPHPQTLKTLAKKLRVKPGEIASY